MPRTSVLISPVIRPTQQISCGSRCVSRFADATYQPPGGGSEKQERGGGFPGCRLGVDDAPRGVGNRGSRGAASVFRCLLVRGTGCGCRGCDRYAGPEPAGHGQRSCPPPLAALALLGLPGGSCGRDTVGRHRHPGRDTVGLHRHREGSPAAALGAVSGRFPRACLGGVRRDRAYRRGTLRRPWTRKLGGASALPASPAAVAGKATQTPWRRSSPATTRWKAQPPATPATVTIWTRLLRTLLRVRRYRMLTTPSGKANWQCGNRTLQRCSAR
jgi:hypothetical protein